MKKGWLAIPSGTIAAVTALTLAATDLAMTTTAGGVISGICAVWMCLLMAINL